MTTPAPSSKGGASKGAGAAALARRGAVRIRSAANADGADRSGLAALLGTHALSAAGDALVAVSLASTTFFSVSATQARGKIALYLLLTLLPFALLVPVAGPLLDRFPHGRRNVLAIACAGRGLIAWTLAGSLASLGLYPQALAILVLQRAYGVARAAAVIRVRPPDLGLVATNARMNIASLASSGIAAAVGVALSKSVGTQWDLRLATVVFLAAGATALRLPSRVDDASSPRASGTGARKFAIGTAPSAIRRALVATVSLRAISGLLTLGLAILLKSHKASAPVVGVILGAAVAGGLVGTALASRLSAERVAKLTALALLAPTVACLLAAVFGTTLFQALAIGVVGLGASLGKYALDAAMQTRVPASQTGSAFARSETALQLGWALGGGIGLSVSLLDASSLGLGVSGAIAICFAVATGITIAGLVVNVRWKGAPVVSARS